MATFKNKALSQIIQKLELEGNRILKECEAERDYTHRTNNLYDSYGFGIYVGGNLEKWGFLSPYAKAFVPMDLDGKEVWGRQEIKNFLYEDYKPTKGIDMVVVAAMPYAEDLEAGVGVKHTYKVISMSYEKLKALQGKIKGSKVAIISRGERI